MMKHNDEHRRSCCHAMQKVLSSDLWKTIRRQARNARQRKAVIAP